MQTQSGFLTVSSFPGNAAFSSSPRDCRRPTRHVGTPKSGRNREIPLSEDALKALKTQRHLRGELVGAGP